MLKTIQKNYKWLILVLICLGIIVPQYGQFMMTEFGIDWLGDHAVDLSKYSEITTAPMIPGIFLSLIIGLLVDRFGLKRVLMVCMTITLIAIILRINVSTYAPMYVYMVLIGVTTTFFNANQMKFVSRWFPRNQQRIAFGIYIAFNNLSMAVGSGVAALFGDYHRGFISAAVYAGIIFIAWMYLGQESPAIPVSFENAEGSPPLLESLKAVLKSGKVWIIGVALLLFQTSAVSIAMFLTPALNASDYDYGKFATIIPLVFAISASVGCVTMPKLIEILPKPKLIIAFLGIVSAVGIAFAWKITFIPLTLICYAVLGFITLGLIPVFSALPLSFKGIGARYAGTAGGVIATFMLLGNVIIPTYIITPITKTADLQTNYTLFFILEGVLMLLFVCLTPILPFKKKDKNA